MTTILSDPSHTIQVSPAIVSRWLATECPNIFQIQRKDFIVNSCNSDGSSPAYLQLVLSSAFTGQEGDSISVYNAYNDTMYTGTVTDIASPATTIKTSIPWVATFDAEYLNDSTLYPGYYFEGRLTVNDAVESITKIASPNSYGVADLDVSGILRIKVSIGKIGDYSDTIIAETNKSGKFTFAYRAMYYGADSDTAYTEEGNTWYYVEGVRSLEQGSNLYEYVPSDYGGVPFYNMFNRPVYFKGLPFDLSFLLPELYEGSPSSNLRATIKQYNSVNTLLSTTTEDIDPASITERMCSLEIDPAIINTQTAYLTAKIDIL